MCVDAVLKPEHVDETPALGAKDASRVRLVDEDVRRLLRDVFFGDPDNIGKRREVAIHAIHQENPPAFNGPQQASTALRGGPLRDIVR